MVENSPVGTETVGKCQRLGTRPHDGHVTLEDVPQLRQFIELCSFEKTAQAGHSPVAFDRQRATGRTDCLAKFAKLINAKVPSKLPEARLRENEWPPIVD